MKRILFLLQLLLFSLLNQCSDHSNNISIIAHRGGANLAPENTLAAFKNAMSLGVDMIEIDVILSKDDEVIVIHDESVDRTTEGSGLVREMTLAQIKNFDAGSRFDKKYANEKVPELSQVLDLLNGEVTLLVEIKGGNEIYPGLEEKVISLIEKYNSTDWTIIQSFNKNTLLRIKQLNKDMTGFYLLGRNGNEYLNSLGSKKNVKKEFDGIGLNYKIANKNNINLLKKLDLKCLVWTVNEIDIMNKMIDLQVDGIITDSPDKLIALLNK